LPGAIEDSRFDRRAMLDVEIDVFYRDRRVIDEDADRECQAAKRHDSDGLTESRKRGQRRKDR
jgi:hypothetical protein